jgi:hypothetical protein
MIRSKKEKERAFEKKLVARATKDGCWCQKSEDVGLTHYPDQLILTPHLTFYWMEFKLEYNDLSEAQEVIIKALKARGHSVYVPKTLDQALLYHEFEMERNK